MSPEHGRTGGHSRMQFVKERQLTVGECIAIERYMRHMADGSPVTVGEILSTIDQLEVCTTCGWSRVVHQAADSGAQEVGICAHWTREL